MYKKTTKNPKIQGIGLEDTLEELEKKHGKGAIMRLGDSVRLNVPAIPTGSITLDMALGIGGVP